MRWPCTVWCGARRQRRVSEAALFAQSLLIGLSIAAPAGPIGLLVIQRTLQRGSLVGLATGLLSCFAGTFVLTLSNPATIFSFIAVFGTFGARLAGGSPWTLIAGVLLGSALWWLLLSAAVGRVRSRFDARAQAWVNRGSALLLAGFALWQLASLAGR